jgi:hypothetical protein
MLSRGGDDRRLSLQAQAGCEVDHAACRNACQRLTAQWISN